MLRPRRPAPGALLRRPAAPAATALKRLNHIEKLEEENWPWYSPSQCYPVRIGETLRARYRVLGKLGYGAHSTVWLCRDHSEKQKYVTVKVCTRDSPSAQRELAAYRHLQSISTSHKGASYVRHLIDDFAIRGIDGEHACLVREPLCMSLATLRELSPGKRLDENLLHAVLEHLLLALDFLHSEAQMAHTDVQALNVHMGSIDDKVYRVFEEDELAEPSPRKVDGDRIIYESRDMMWPGAANIGHPVLCDFGEARRTTEPQTDLIQPDVYRAPEVMLNIPWSSSADIWNLGMLSWHLLEGKPLFDCRGSDGQYSLEHHLAELVALLGRPPPEIVRRNRDSARFFDADGRWIATAPLSKTSLKAREHQLNEENKAEFLNFIRKCLQWTPEDRPTAKELLNDPWLSN